LLSQIGESTEKITTFLSTCSQTFTKEMIKGYPFDIPEEEPSKVKNSSDENI